MSVWVAALSILLGCNGPKSDVHMQRPAPDNPASTQPAQWLQQPGPVAEHRDFDRLWAAAEQAARGHGFTLDRIDYRAGVLTTEPLVSKQFFEFWRKDVGTAAGTAESSLATVRRTVRFEFNKGGTGGYRVKPKVLVERYSTPERRITSTHQYRRLLTTPNPERMGGSAYWYPVDRDTELEGRLVEAIERRLNDRP